jgi:hypothetical protein
MFKDEVLRMEDGLAFEDSDEESVLIPHSPSTSFSDIGPGFRGLARAFSPLEQIARVEPLVESVLKNSPKREMCVNGAEGEVGKKTKNGASTPPTLRSSSQRHSRAH